MQMRHWDEIRRISGVTLKIDEPDCSLSDVLALPFSTQFSEIQAIAQGVCRIPVFRILV
jgi:hypothetical protein